MVRSLVTSSTTRVCDRATPPPTSASCASAFSSLLSPGTVAVAVVRRCSRSVPGTASSAPRGPSTVTPTHCAGDAATVSSALTSSRSPSSCSRLSRYVIYLSHAYIHCCCSLVGRSFAELSRDARRIDGLIDVCKYNALHCIVTRVMSSS